MDGADTGGPVVAEEAMQDGGGVEAGDDEAADERDECDVRLVCMAAGP